jgi:hypothetical protein
VKETLSKEMLAGIAPGALGPDIVENPVSVAKGVHAKDRWHKQGKNEEE